MTKSRRFPHLLATFAAASVLTGCVSTKYKLAKPEDTPLAIALNLTTASAPGSVEGKPLLDATVHTVIVYQGPGSWKRAAYWDEYVLTVVNRGSTAVTIESATLTDFQGQPVKPGDNPWDLEKQSRSYETRVLNSVGDVLKVGSATVLTSAAAGGVAVLGALNVASQFGAAMVVGGTVMFAAATVVVPVWSVVANVNGRHDVEAEYRRRRVTLPLWLVPSQLAQGSFFFRISPGPRQLVLHCRADREPHDVTIDLEPLAGLHLKANPVTVAATAP